MKHLLIFMKKNVRSVLEYASVVWSSSITKKNTAQIERVQKAAFAIVQTVCVLSTSLCCAQYGYAL